MIRLRFAIEVDFDSVESAKAYGVALGFKLGEIEQNAIAISESPAPAIERRKFEVTEARRG